jgi:hypothetical protein
MKKLIIALFMCFCLIGTVNAEEITKTFAWDEPTDLIKITQWELYMGETSGGPYAKVTDILKVPDQTVFEAPATVDIVGAPGTNETRYFVLIACGDQPLEGGETEYQCSADSNEVNFSVWIPADAFNVPVLFRIIPNE